MKKFLPVFTFFCALWAILNCNSAIATFVDELSIGSIIFHNDQTLTPCEVKWTFPDGVISVYVEHLKLTAIVCPQEFLDQNGDPLLVRESEPQPASTFEPTERPDFKFDSKPKNFVLGPCRHFMRTLFPGGRPPVECSLCERKRKIHCKQALEGENSQAAAQDQDMH